MKGPLAEITLHPGKEKSILRKHPWVFSGAIKKVEGHPKDGDWIRVVDSHGRFLAFGHYFEGNITVKIVCFEEVPLDEGFWKEKVSRAFERRKWCGLIDSKHTTTFRLINGEGDDFPGLIVDVYGNVQVLQAHSVGMHRNISSIAAAVGDVSNGKICFAYDKSKDALPSRYGASVDNQWMFGKTHSEKIVVWENGMKMQVDVVNGQKTGFFIDQRDSRKLLKEYAMGKKVLNTFCYTGGFSIAAAMGGAVSVTSVDVSASAVALTQDNLVLNGVSPEGHPCIRKDVYDYLKYDDALYDIVVLDPPAFAKSLSKRHNAIQGYRRLNSLGMDKVAKGGLLFTFSCSQVVDMEAFQGAVLSAAIECGRPVKILHRLSQPPDHPVNLYHPEGAYLKGLVLQIE